MVELSKIIALIFFGVMFAAIVIGKVCGVIPALIGVAITIIILALLFNDSHLPYNVRSVRRMVIYALPIP